MNMIISKVAFKEGRKAYNDGKAKSENPYPKFDKNQLKIPNREYISWNQGYDYVKKGNIEESKMSNIQRVLNLLEMATPEEQEIAQKTSRNLGAVGAKAIVPKIVRQYANKDKDVILDFGAGKAASHTLSLRDEGYNVTAYDFSQSEHHDPTALKRKYTMVFASNVLNVQGSEDMLMNDTLIPISRVLKTGGRFIGNLPSSPLKGLYNGLTYKEAINLLESKLREVFSDVKKLEGSTPIWICTK